MNKYFGEFELIGVEHLLLEHIEEFETQLNFKGFIDTVIKTKDNKIHILDLKTTSWGWDAEKKNDKKVLYQLIYYKNYYAKKYNIPLQNIECEFVLLKRTAKKDPIEIFKITSGKKRIENAIEYLKGAVVNIERGNFPKNKLSCENCLFRHTEHCK
jgi:hypothetical protein